MIAKDWWHWPITDLKADLMLKSGLNKTFVYYPSPILFYLEDFNYLPIVNLHLKYSFLLYFSLMTVIKYMINKNHEIKSV